MCIVLPIPHNSEAKVLGVKMGEPWHIARQRPEVRSVAWYSSNYALYADMSRRMYEVLQDHVPTVEPYSIDEMFLDLDALPGDLHERCAEIRDAVWCHAKIPTCIGWGPTKTIAKLANGLAKSSMRFGGLCDLTNVQIRQEWYAVTSIEEVWGIGRKTVKKLQMMGVQTIADFVELDPKVARKLLTVVGARVQAELKGQSCLALSDVASARKSIASTRTFGRLLTEWNEIREALACYATRAAEKLRSENLEAAHISVFLQTNPNSSDPKYYKHIGGNIEPTSDTRDLIQHAAVFGKAAWLPHYRYFKAGVILTDLRPMGMQSELFMKRQPETSKMAMKIMDHINARFGTGTLRASSIGIKQNWIPRSAFRSGRYTTCISEIIKAKSW
ncbi:Y-family DNA polymerase [Neokomagataea tanensis]|uniref:Y-family DNA polymerase n=1 Tax=Neokomagataea TaxID=1223423 RepID=UPI001F0D7A88|nr:MULTISPECIES: Y-family DNA polymerase [Neokomagataea]